jgi:hypothetical protein
MLTFSLALLGVSSLAIAQTKYAQAGMPFLKIDVGARSAMGGTYLGIVGDVESMYSNPAGLAFMPGFQVASTATNWIADIKHYAVGAAYRWGNIGTFGVNSVWMDNGEMKRTIPYTGTDPDLRNAGFVDMGSFTIQEYAIGFSYARQITDRFSIGGQLKYAKQDLGSVLIEDPVSGNVFDKDNNVSNILLDFGTVYYPGWHDLRFGVSIRQFGNQSDYFDQRFELPITFNFGLAVDALQIFSNLDPEQEQDMRLTVAADWVHPRDYDPRQHLGLEFALKDLLFVRGGYKFNYDEEGLTAGIGVKKAFESFGARFDYTYTDFGIFDNVNRFTMGIFVK